MCPRARAVRTALQVVPNSELVQSFRSFATPKRWYTEVVHKIRSGVSAILILSDSLRFRDRWMRVPHSPPTIIAKLLLRHEKLRIGPSLSVTIGAA